MRNLVSLEEAAVLYGCQVSEIQGFINRSKLNPIHDEQGHILLRSQEVTELKQKHLCKKIVASKTRGAIPYAGRNNIDSLHPDITGYKRLG